MRWVLVVIGVVLVGSGAACLNYVKAETIEHHREWAAARGMPAPSATIQWGGLAAAVVGGFVLGLAAARRGARAHAPP